MAFAISLQVAVLRWPNHSKHHTFPHPDLSIHCHWPLVHTICPYILRYTCTKMSIFRRHRFRPCNFHFHHRVHYHPCTFPPSGP